MGSAGWRQVARAQLLVGLDPDDEKGADGPARCVALTKHNLGPWKPTRRFALETVPVAVEGRTQETVRAVLGKECEVASHAMLAAEAGHEDAGNTKADKASKWLIGQMGGAPMAVAAIKEAAAEAGHSWRTVERAKENLGVIPRKEGTQGWTWHPPGAIEF